MTGQWTQSNENLSSSLTSDKVKCFLENNCRFLSNTCFQTFIYVVSGEVDFRGITMEANSLLQIDSAFGEVNITSNSSKTRYICVHISKK